MTPAPRQIYSSSVSRRDRAWGRGRRRPPGAFVPVLARLGAVTAFAATVAWVLLPRLGA
jgi:hypothetical protein